MVKILTSVIQHELGHGFAYDMLGPNIYNSAGSEMIENWSIWYTNWSYRKENNISLEMFRPWNFTRYKR